jgi:hypothetical protein
MGLGRVIAGAGPGVNGLDENNRQHDDNNGEITHGDPKGRGGMRAIHLYKREQGDFLYSTEFALKTQPIWYEFG